MFIVRDRNAEIVPPRTLEPVRLATFNVLHGRSLDDGAVERERFRSVIADLKADVLGLQEVDRGRRAAVTSTSRSWPPRRAARSRTGSRRR
ncbi:hypothetical protein Phou_002860 [Phytohabitans houttuyneae]|uniref:Endonuclease/exonuclease/phosphatase domain-containing protein n=1 Tax=Phytohabitans houttuyneae TaxID=1076126 RepID=A0A6V8K2C7_9ACTN|nr:hypothetical protein Phou_002860 [Phytohabitans houttuyneae]